MSPHIHSRTSDMPNIFEGQLTVGSGRWAIVVGRWNSFISDRLVEGAIDCLVRHGADDSDIDVYKVPGSFEIPLAAQRIAQRDAHVAVICIGTLIRGATPHFDHIAAECTKGIGAVSLETGVPMSYGVLTCDTIEQAVERAGTKAGNKGAEAALAAIEMVNLFANLEH